MDTVPWHSLELDEVFKRTGSHREGLSSSEASERLMQFGYNVIARL